MTLATGGGVFLAVDGIVAGIVLAQAQTWIEKSLCCRPKPEAAIMWM